MSDSSPPQQWSPHLWEGMDYFAWNRLLLPNLHRVHPAKWYVAAIVSGVSLVHTALRLAHDGCFRHRLRRVRVRPPLFILGHWRSGTTLLHELLIRDRRHASPNTYQCLAPHHPLFSEAAFKWLFPHFIPSQRPMDAMAAGWERPQEDEFALAMLGQPSLYTFLAFPDQPLADPGCLDFVGWPSRKLHSWKRSLYQFLQLISFIYPGRRLVLKSPTHTARVRTLLQLFPGAQFVYTARDPVAVFASTVKLWKSLAAGHSLQRPTFHHLNEFVLSTFERLDAAYVRDRELLRPNQLVELRYEDFIADPLNQLRSVYDRLNLGDFAAVEPAAAEYLRAVAGHPTGRYDVADDLRDAIRRRWGGYARRHGYSV